MVYACTYMLTRRTHGTGLSRLVRAWPGVRAASDAHLLTLLLPQSHQPPTLRPAHVVTTPAHIGIEAISRLKRSRCQVRHGRALRKAGPRCGRCAGAAADCLLARCMRVSLSVLTARFSFAIVLLQTLIQSFIIHSFNHRSFIQFSIIKSIHSNIHSFIQSFNCSIVLPFSHFIYPSFLQCYQRAEGNNDREGLALGT
jgi:hypothetical protein